MPPAIPHLLTSCLALPEETSLILLTSILGASTNWLVTRFLTSTLAASPETPVLLVSFLRDLKFFAESSKRLGVDLIKAQASGTFGFVDGLTGLFTVQSGTKGSNAQIKGGGTNAIQAAITEGMKRLKGGGKCLLVIDGLDLVLAAGGDACTTSGLHDMLMELRQHVHATVLTLSADTPLVHEQHTPLELNHSSFLLSVAHQADLIMALRLLDTGTARDVSGVLRITKGDVDGEDHDAAERIESRELLYYIGGDGGAKVFERGQ